MKALTPVLLLALGLALAPLGCNSPEREELAQAIEDAQDQEAESERSLEAIDAEIDAILKKRDADGDLDAADAVRLMDLQREREVEAAYQRGIQEAITEARVEVAEETAGQGVRQGDKILREVGEGDGIGILSELLVLLGGLGGTYVAVRRKLEARIKEESDRRDASRREMGLAPASQVVPRDEMVVTTRNVDRTLSFLANLPELEDGPEPPQGA